MRPSDFIRPDGRRHDQLRRVRFVKHYTKHADGSCLVEFGETKVLCTAMVEDGVPPFLKDTGTGWVTAEYGMLPSSCPQRIKRNQVSGRMQEIQRLIGRSLRVVVDTALLGERTIKIDCDVLQADGGTRTASITGGFVALALAVKKLCRTGLLSGSPIKDAVAAVSVGIVNGVECLDLNYDEDAQAQMDMNVVMVGRGQFVEIQGTAEQQPFTKTQLDRLLKLAHQGIERILLLQRKEVGSVIGS